MTHDEAVIYLRENARELVEWYIAVTDASPYLCRDVNEDVAGRSYCQWLADSHKEWLKSQTENTK